MHFSCNIDEIKKHILDLLSWGRLNYLLWQGLGNPTPIFGNRYLTVNFRNIKMGIFDLNTLEEFFQSICRILEQYKVSTAKNIEDLLYILMGLNHLREWIAPGYDWKKPPKEPKEEFFQSIRENLFLW